MSVRDHPDVIDAFRQRVAERPDHCAVEAPTGSLTYRQLEHRSNQLARFLAGRGAAPETIVGIAGHRAPTTVVGILGIVKTGAAYLPLDPAQPAARLAGMIDDATPRLVLQDDPSATFPGPTVSQHTEQLAISAESAAPTSCAWSGRSLAYVIYTSGSTGTPKGVLIERQGLADMAMAHVRAFAIGGASRVLQFASFGFDASVSELFMTLCGGGTLCMAGPNDGLLGAELVSLLHARRISNVLLPPTVLAQLPEHPLPHLRTIIAGGERCPGELVRRWGRGREFFNAYGPTEGTVTATLHRCAPNATGDPPIGAAREGVRLHVLGDDQRPAPVGATGELCIGGSGVARGYLHRADLTTSRFVPDPDSSGGRLYRTGDLVRQRADGLLEFVGRSDRQVQIHGARIELGEIEAVLALHPNVTQVAATVGDDGAGAQRIVACFTHPRGDAPSPTTLRAWLRDRLPSQMLPWRYVPVATLPLNASGEIDYTALPPPSAQREPGAAPTEPPSLTPLEQLLHQLWCSVLGLSPRELSIDDPFVEVGGDSLLAVRIAERLDERGLPVRPQDLLDYPSIRRLAGVVATRGGEPPAPDNRSRTS